MLIVAAKIGFGFSMFLVLLGTLQSQTITDMAVALLAAGILPGTNFQIPAELSLICVAGALMLIVAWVFKNYATDQRLVSLAARDYPNFSEDPGYDMLIPGLRRVMSARLAAASTANDFLINLYFWLRSLGRPVIAQAIAVRKGLTSSFVRVDSLAADKADLRVFAENAASAIKAGVSYWFKIWDQISRKARAYLVKFILS